MGFRGYPNPLLDGDDGEDLDLPDALDVDRTDDPNLRRTIQGQGMAAAIAARTEDPEFEIVRQAYPNRPRPWRPLC